MLEKQIQRLREKGFKITPKIRAVLDLFREKTEYMSVVEIQEQLFLRNMTFGLPTIYRILERLEQSGIILTFKTIDRQVYYFQCRSENSLNHHHHFVCKKCRKVEEVSLCAFNVVQNHIEQNLNACVESHYLHIEGLCSECK